MKKIQATLYIILTAVLLLSGCDAVLEAFYPEFAYSKGDDNVISIFAEFNLYPNQVYGKNQYLVGRVIEKKSDEVVRELRGGLAWHWVEQKNLLYWRVVGNLDIYGVEDGSYEVLVWLEQDGDGEPYGADEPWTYAKNKTNGTITFTFPDANAPGGWLDGEATAPLR